MNRTIADFYARPAGTVVGLTADHSVTIGQVVDYPLHPSGENGKHRTCVVVGGYLGSLGHPMVKIISIADPVFRVVVVSADAVA